MGVVWGGRSALEFGCIGVNLLRTMSIQRPRIAQIIAQALMQEIENGKFADGYLPGVTALAKKHKVAIRSMMSAVKLLEDANYVTKVKPRHRRAICYAGGKLKKDRTTLLIIAPAKKQLAESQLSRLQDAIDVWKEEVTNGSSIEIYTSTVKSRQEIDEIVATKNIKGILMQEAPKEWSVVLKGIDVPIYRLGGYEIETPWGDSGWAVNGREVSESLLNRLAEFGHSKVLMPLHNETFADDYERAYRNSAIPTEHLNDIQLAAYFPLFPIDNLAVSNAFWAKILASTQPTTVVCFNQPIFFSLYGFCAATGISIPRHLSVFAFSRCSQLEWLSPRIATPAADPFDERIELFRKWIQQGFIEQGFKWLPIEFDFAESVLDLR